MEIVTISSRDGILDKQEDQVRHSFFNFYIINSRKIRKVYTQKAKVRGPLDLKVKRG
jgi:agmatine/peptidylarginine deiminase